MVTANLHTQSQQGDPQAIATLISQHLQPQGITAKVVRNASTLKVLLESEETPDRSQLAPFVLQSVASLKLPSLQTLQVYGRRIHDTAPAWTKTFSLSPEAIASELSLDTEMALGQPFLAESQSEPRVDEAQLQAIASHLTEAIANDQITIQIIAEDQLLKVIAETDQFLQGPAFAEKIYQHLKNLDLSGFETVGIYKKKVKRSQFFQIKSFTLDAPTA